MRLFSLAVTACSARMQSNTTHAHIPCSIRYITSVPLLLLWAMRIRRLRRQQRNELLRDMTTWHEHCASRYALANWKWNEQISSKGCSYMTLFHPYWRDQLYCFSTDIVMTVCNYSYRHQTMMSMNLACKLFRFHSSTHGEKPIWTSLDA